MKRRVIHHAARRVATALPLRPSRASHVRKLSVAADPARYSFSAGWCIRRRRTPVGGQDEAPARHGGG